MQRAPAALNYGKLSPNSPALPYTLTGAPAPQTWSLTEEQMP